jgi:hypothetical protein
LPKASFAMTDLWVHAELGRKDLLDVTLRPHACALYRLR